MTKPTVSIIMATFNNSQMIDQSIMSVLEQSYNDWEFIIIDDHSSDDTKERITKFVKNDNRLLYIYNKNNQGLTKSLNIGIKRSKGKYMARIDGDDYWVDQNKLKNQVEFLNKNNEYGLVGTWAIAINAQGKEVFKLRYPSTDVDIRQSLLRHNCFIHSSILARLDLVKKVGLYDERDYVSQDYCLWLNLGSSAKFFNIPKFMVAYRINVSGISQTKYNLQRKMVLNHIKTNRNNYPNYYQALIIWHIRSIYPKWFRNNISNKFKNYLYQFFKL